MSYITSPQTFASLDGLKRAIVPMVALLAGSALALAALRTMTYTLVYL